MGIVFGLSKSIDLGTVFFIVRRIFINHSLTGLQCFLYLIPIGNLRNKVLILGSNKNPHYHDFLPQLTDKIKPKKSVQIKRILFMWKNPSLHI